MLFRKKDNRCLSIDLNPNYIGCSILDKTDNFNEPKIIKAWYYDLRKLNRKLSRTTTIKQRKTQTNKRNNEKIKIQNSIQLLRVVGVRYSFDGQAESNLD